jgi:hypothetical protein
VTYLGGKQAKLEGQIFDIEKDGGSKESKLLSKPAWTVSDALRPSLWFALLLQNGSR